MYNDGLFFFSVDLTSPLLENVPRHSLGIPFYLELMAFLIRCWSLGYISIIASVSKCDQVLNVQRLDQMGPFHILLDGQDQTKWDQTKWEYIIHSCHLFLNLCRGCYTIRPHFATILFKSFSIKYAHSYRPLIKDILSHCTEQEQPIEI